MPPSEPDDFSVREHHFDAQDIVGGHPVFEAMHAAGILGDIATDRARDLARRIWRIIEALPFYLAGDREIGDARLQHDHAVIVVDLKDAVEPCHTQQHSIRQWQGASG